MYARLERCQIYLTHKTYLYAAFTLEASKLEQLPMQVTHVNS